MRTVGCCGYAPGPSHEIEGVVKTHTAEEVSSAAMCPGFGDQGATSETGLVGVEVVKNLVHDLDGYVNGGSTALGVVACELPGVVRT